MRTILTIQIDYDPDVTDPEGLAVAMDRLLETAISIPGVLDEYGNPTLGEFYVLAPSRFGVYALNICTLRPEVFLTNREAQAVIDDSGYPNDFTVVEITGIPGADDDEVEDVAP